mgnify:CR=1 FL=1
MEHSIINKENLMYSELKQSDATDLLSIYTNNDEFIQGKDLVKSIEDAEKFIIRLNEGLITKTVFYWGIFISENKFLSSKKRLIGIIKWEKDQINLKLNGIFEWSLFIIIKKEYQNFGIASISLLKFETYFFEKNNKLLFAYTNPYNIKAIRLFDRLKYTIFGINSIGYFVVYKVKPDNFKIKEDIETRKKFFVSINVESEFEGDCYKKAFNCFPYLETENIILREFKEQDIEEYFDFFRDQDICNEFDRCNSLDDSMKLIKYSFPRAFIERKYITWAIISKRNNELIGLRDCFIDSNNQPVVTQGLIKQSARGKGFHQEALNEVIKFLKDCKFSSIMANASSSNVTAIHVLKKFGFIEVEKMRYINSFQPKDRKKFILNF